jgi:hypothetical protein
MPSLIYEMSSFELTENGKMARRISFAPAELIGASA